MDITTEPEPSKLYVISVAVLLAAFGVFSLYFAISTLIELLAELSNENELITFEKGVFYMFGVGSGLITIVVWSLFSKIYKKNYLKE